MTNKSMLNNLLPKLSDKLVSLPDEKTFKTLSAIMSDVDITTVLTAFVAARTSDQVFACLRQTEIARLEPLQHWLTIPTFFIFDLNTSEGFAITKQMAHDAYELIDTKAFTAYEIMGDKSLVRTVSNLSATN